LTIPKRLFLTNRKGVVVVEGFSVSELNEKLRTVTGRRRALDEVLFLSIVLPGGYTVRSAMKNGQGGIKCLISTVART
jgi:hypothetical protein